MTKQEIAALILSAFPGFEKSGVVIESVAHRASRLRFPIGDFHLRPGGTVSGPTMFFLADTALYIAVLASIGPKPLAVTANMTINFLRRPAPKDMIAECRLLKIGVRLAVGEVTLFSDGEEEPVAHATGSYSIPA